MAKNSIKRTLIYGPNGIRFREIPLYEQEGRYDVPPLKAINIKFKNTIITFYHNK